MSDRYEDGTEWLVEHDKDIKSLVEWSQIHDKELLQIVGLLDTMSVQIKSLQIRIEQLEGELDYEDESYEKEGYGGTEE